MPGSVATEVSGFAVASGCGFVVPPPLPPPLEPPPVGAPPWELPPSVSGVCEVLAAIARPRTSRQSEYSSMSVGNALRALRSSEAV
jgi:hypothetical protein